MYSRFASLSVGLIIVAAFCATGCSQALADAQPAVLHPPCTWGHAYRDSVPYLVPGLLDTHATYWAYGYDETATTAGIAINFTGQFPYARYMSFIAYDEQGNTVAQLFDTQITPQSGSVNPYQAGVPRDATSRSYSVWMVPQGSPHAHQPNTLVIPSSVKIVDVLLRVYLPDQGKSDDGGVGLPQIHALDDATGQAAGCPTYRYPIPPGVFGKASNYQSFLNQQTIDSYRVTGANYQGDGSNPYLIAPLLRQETQVAVLRWRVPTTPNTYAGGGSFTGQEQMRYWSVCYDDALTEGTGSCLADDEMTKTDGNWVTLVIGPATVASAAQRQGANFIAWGVNTKPLLDFRQIIPAAAYAYPFTLVPAIDLQQLTTTMIAQDRAANFIGNYAPQGVYCSAQAFTANTCG